MQVNSSVLKIKRDNIMRSELDMNIVFYGTILYIASSVFEGPLRYILYLNNAIYIFYIRDIFLISVISYYLIISILNKNINNMVLYILLILLFHSVIGFYYNDNYTMVIFGWKIFMPLLFGIIAYPSFEKRIDNFKIFSLIFAFSAMIGVFINYNIELPWEGLNYEIMGMNIEAVRASSMQGIKRVGGLGKSYWQTSVLILLLTTFCMVYLKKEFFKGFIWIIAGVAIFITTQRTVFVVYILIAFVGMLFRIIKYPNRLYGMIMLVALLFNIIFPLAGSIPFVDNYYNEPAFQFQFAGFLERINKTWPEAIELLQKEGNILIGKGLGSIGGSQLYFDPRYGSDYNVIDSLFLYFYISFGLFSFLYIIYIYKKYKVLNNCKEIYYYDLLLIIILLGITANVVEDNILCLFFGILLGRLNNKQFICSDFIIPKNKCSKYCSIYIYPNEVNKTFH